MVWAAGNWGAGPAPPSRWAWSRGWMEGSGWLCSVRSEGPVRAQAPGSSGDHGASQTHPGLCPWQVGATVRIEHRSSRLCGQYPSWNSLPPLAGQTAEASEDPPPWVIICFWYGSVCPQGLSGYRADFQKWGQGGDMCWAGPRSAGNPGGPNKPWPWGEGCVFRRGAG